MGCCSATTLWALHHSPEKGGVQKGQLVKRSKKKHLVETGHAGNKIRVSVGWGGTLSWVGLRPKKKGKKKKGFHNRISTIKKKKGDKGGGKIATKQLPKKGLETKKNNPSPKGGAFTRETIPKPQKRENKKPKHDNPTTLVAKHHFYSGGVGWCVGFKRGKKKQCSWRGRDCKICGPKKNRGHCPPKTHNPRVWIMPFPSQIVWIFVGTKNRCWGWGQSKSRFVKRVGEGSSVTPPKTKRGGGRRESSRNNGSKKKNPLETQTNVAMRKNLLGKKKRSLSTLVARGGGGEKKNPTTGGGVKTRGFKHREKKKAKMCCCKPKKKKKKKKTKKGSL